MDKRIRFGEGWLILLVVVILATGLAFDLKRRRNNPPSAPQISEQKVPKEAATELVLELWSNSTETTLDCLACPEGTVLEFMPSEKGYKFKVKF